MQIICISRCSYSFGKELAEKLASKLGYEYIAREELTDQATACGISVGKLETAIFKQQLITEELSIEIELFKAFLTVAICEKAKKGGVVYHGRVGHMIFRDFSSILSIRAIADKEERINRVMKRMNLTHELAKKYIDQVDEDRCRYTQFFYNVNCNEPSLYDIVINSKQLFAEDYIDALARAAKLSKFQFTSASIQKIDDLILQAKCRLAIGEDERTRTAKVNVRAFEGNVSLTYLPPSEKQVELIPEILKKIDGLRSLVCTMAATNILFIEERFNPEAESFGHLVEIAGKWNASIELGRFDHQLKEEESLSQDNLASPGIKSRESDGGILDDTFEPDEEEKGSYGIPETVNKLIQVGRAGAVNAIHGGIQPLVKKIKSSRGYCLVVVGDVYLSSGTAARKRMKRNLISLIADQSRIPVISSDELKEKYLFGPRQIVNTFVFACLSLLIYYLIFTNQDLILKFISATETEVNILAVAVIVIFVPFAAYMIGGFWHNILKLLKLE